MANFDEFILDKEEASCAIATIIKISILLVEKFITRNNDISFWLKTY